MSSYEENNIYSSVNNNIQSKMDETPTASEIVLQTLPSPRRFSIDENSKSSTSSNSSSIISSGTGTGTSFSEKNNINKTETSENSPLLNQLNKNLNENINKINNTDSNNCNENKCNDNLLKNNNSENSINEIDQTDNIIEDDENKFSGKKFREKCAEIYIENGVYFINCEFCDDNFNNFKNFSNHMLDSHLSIPITHPKIEHNNIMDESLSFNDSIELKEILNRKFNVTLVEAHIKNINKLSHINTESIKDNITESILIEDDDDDDIDFKSNAPLNNIENISCEIDADLFLSYNNDDDHNEYNIERHPLPTPQVETKRSFEEQQKQFQQKLQQQRLQNQQLQNRQQFNNYRHSVPANLSQLHHQSQNASYFNSNELRLDVLNNSSIMKNQWFREQDGRYHCQYCDKNYQYSKSLKEHIESQHKPVDKDFVCTICSKAFSKQWKLNTHLKVHTDERPFVCTVCVMTFKWKKNLQRHLMRIHNIRLSDLPRDSYCNNTSKLKELLEKPNNIDNNSIITDSMNLNDSMGISDPLGRCFNDQNIDGLAADFAIVNHCIDDDLVQDIKDPSKSSIFLKRKLETNLNLNDNLSSDFLSRTIKIEKNYDDTTNNNFLNIRENLYPEAKRGKPNRRNDYNYYQNTYGNSYGDEFIPIDHSLQSNKLNSIRNNFNSFDQNQQPHFVKVQPQPATVLQQDKDGLFTCKVCKKVYLRKDSLRAHMRIHTAGLECKYCGKMFTHKYFLERHIRTHTGERPFKCHLCSLAFADENTLKNHIKTHTGEKKFECQFCHKKFIKQYEKIDHERNVHNNQNPYECKDCTQVFSQFKFLRYHKRNCPNRKSY